MTAGASVLETNIGSGAIPRRRGKVRDVYDLGDRLLLVATDRISAFDWVLPTAIPDKGRVLTSLSAFWFSMLKVPNHLISTSTDDLSGLAPFGEGEPVLAAAGQEPRPPVITRFALGLDLHDDEKRMLEGRFMLVRKANVVPFECVVRGYLSGSAWKEYRATGTVCGQSLPAGLVESDRIGPIFTPATKAETGHDENVSLEVMASAIGKEVADTLKSSSLEVYEIAASHAAAHGLILADTKFEWGFDARSGELLLVDEVLTPDSSRYWPQDSYRPGGPQPSFDKQYVRDWLEASGWDKSSPPPELPGEVVARTRSKYIEAFERLTERPFPWK
jgi:phosphoribosylaminoimidazole-succinocarboxamide synthase